MDFIVDSIFNQKKNPHIVPKSIPKKKKKTIEKHITRILFSTVLVFSVNKK